MRGKIFAYAVFVVLTVGIFSPALQADYEREEKVVAERRGSLERSISANLTRTPEEVSFWQSTDEMYATLNEPKYSSEKVWPVYSHKNFPLNGNFSKDFLEEITRKRILTEDSSPSENTKVIIQFHDAPIGVYITDLKKGFDLDCLAVNSYKEKILHSHNSLKKDLKIYNIDANIKREYSYVFNGMALSVSQEDIEKLQSLPYVKAVYPDNEVWICLNESVPLINADKVWKIQNATGTNVTGKDIIIAIIDTGIDYMHPDLGGGFGPSYKVIGGHDFYNDDNDPIDDHGHGTHCASIAAGMGNASGGKYKGVAPDSKLLAYKVLSASGGGYESDIIAGVEAAVTNGSHVISMSLGGSGNPDDAMSQAIDNAVASGVVCAVAAGNEGPDYQTIASPGCARKAITVGATVKNDTLIYFSSRGPTSIIGIKPDVLAPGVNIVAARANGTSMGSVIDANYTSASGTSMATPHVAGAVALLLQHHKNWTPEMVKGSLMKPNSVNLNYHPFEQGAGRIDVLKVASAQLIVTPQSFSIRNVSTSQANHTIIFYNVGSTSISMTISTSCFFGVYPDSVNYSAQYNYLTVNMSSISIAPYCNTTVNTSISIPASATEGFYLGNISIYNATTNFTLHSVFGKRMDRVYTSECNITNQVVIWNGNITIKNGGKVKFENTTLIMSGVFDTQETITVESGGELYFLNSKLQAHSKYYHYPIKVYGKMDARDSNISNLWGEIWYFWGLPIYLSGGIQVYSNETVIERCNISDSIAGVYCYQSSPVIINNTLSAQGYGVKCYYSSSMVANNIVDVYGDMGWGIGYSYQPSPTVINNIVKVNAVWGGGINPSYNSSSFVVNNTVIVNEWAYGFYFYESSLDTVIENKIYISAGSWGTGILLIGSSPLITNTMINSNDSWAYGVCSYESSYHGYTSSPTMVNVTLQGSYMYGICLDDASHIECLNTTFLNPYFADDNSTLNVSWYLHINVLQNDTPIQGAAVTIYNVTGNNVFSGLTDANGWIRWITIKEYTQNKTVKTSYTPHNVTATKGEYSEFKIVNVNQSKEVIIRPNRAPVITSSEPSITNPTINETESMIFNVLASDPDNDTLTYTWLVNGSQAGMNVTKIRVHFEKIETETNFDYVYIYDKNDVELNTYTGTYADIWSSWSNGDTIRVRLTTDSSVTKWGFKIDKIEYCITSEITIAESYVLESAHPYANNYNYTWTITKSDPNTNTFVFNTNFDSAGIYNITVKVSDGKLDVSHSWILTVVNINRAPSIDYYQPQFNSIINETEQAMFNVSVSDPDNDLLTINWYVNDSLVATGLSYIFASNYDSAGTYTIKVAVFDGSLYANHSWILTVLNVNRAPIIESYSPTTNPTITEEETQLFTISTSDPDNDVVTINWYLNDTFVATGNSCTFIGNYTSAGWYNVKVIISDGDLSINRSWVLTVLNVNRAPQITSSSPTTNPVITEEQSQLFTVSASDPDNDTLTTAWYLNNTLVATGDSYTFTANYTSGGWYEVKVVVSDGELSANHSWILTVTNVNRAPVINSYSPEVNQMISEEESQTFTISASDPDGDNLIINWYLNTSLVATGNSYTFTANYTSAGMYELKVIVSDGSLSVNRSWILTVTNINRHPTIETIGDKIAYEGQVFNLQISATDPDNDTLTFSDNTTLFNINPVTGLISFTPNYDSAGVYFINITVTDGTGIVWQIFKLTIINVNRAPVINSTSPAPNPTIYEGQSQTFTIDAYDPDGNIPEITWKLDGTTIGVDISYLFSTNYTSSGQHVINVTITDGEYFVYHQWTLIVYNTNRAPSAILTSPAQNAKFKTEDNIYFDANGSFDLDNDTLTYAWTSSIDGNIGDTKIFYKKLSAGIHTITLTVGDGTDTDYKQIVITVEPPPAPKEEPKGFIPGFEAFILLIVLATVVISIKRKKRKLTQPPSQQTL